MNNPRPEPPYLAAHLFRRQPLTGVLDLEQQIHGLGPFFECRFGKLQGIREKIDEDLLDPAWVNIEIVIGEILDIINDAFLVLSARDNSLCVFNAVFQKLSFFDRSFPGPSSFTASAVPCWCKRSRVVTDVLYPCKGGDDGISAVKDGAQWIPHLVRGHVDEVLLLSFGLNRLLLAKFLLVQLPFLYRNVAQAACKRLDYSVRTLDWHESSKNPSGGDGRVTIAIFANPTIAEAELGRFSTSGFYQFIETFLKNMKVLLDNAFWPGTHIDFGEVDFLQSR
ncbi:hypothetical protein HG531_012828 [Fusarium graminearum]|nr:hypothetical protein HG531_012828 [Fusarium graminearum]